MYRLANIIGVHYSWISIATSILLTLVTISTFFSIASFTDPDLYFFERRVTYHTNEIVDIMLDQRIVQAILSTSLVLWIFLSVSRRRERILSTSIVIFISILSIYIGGSYSYMIAIFAFPSIVTLFVLRRTSRFNLLVPDTSTLFGNYFFLTLVILSVISVLYSFGFVGTKFGGEFSDYSYLFANIFSWFSPVIVFLLVFSLPSKIIWDELRHRSRLVLNRLVLDLSAATLSKRSKSISLVSIIVLAIVMTFIPHIQSEHPIGVDTIQYAEITDTLLRPGTSAETLFWQLFNEYSDGDRPFTILLILPIVLSLSPYLSTVDSIELVLPMILAPSLSMAIFFLTREITKNEVLAILSAFLTMISPQFLIGIYAGFYANWLALILAFISSTFMFMFLRTSSFRCAVLFFATLVVVIFTHTYTYTVFALVLTIFLVSSLFLRSFGRKVITIAIIVIILSVIADLTRSEIIGSSSGVTLNLGVAENTDAGLSQFASRWSNLVRTVQVHVGGIFGNGVFLMSLAFVGVLLVSKKTNLVLTSFLISFLSIGILPLLFGDRVVMTRILYNIPFQIPASIALLWMARQGHVGILASIALTAYTWAISIRLLTNFQEI